MITNPVQSMTLGTVLLLASVLLATGCGAGSTVLEAPSNQRYWHESGNFVVLHWDAVSDAKSYEVYYFRGDCAQDNWCRAEGLGETPSTSAAISIDMGLYSYRCDQGQTCSRGPLPSVSDFPAPTKDASDRVHDFRVAACARRGCSDVESIGPAQRLDSPDGSLPDTPSGFEAEKVNNKNAPDDVRVFWEPVHGATFYEIWVGSDPSSEFRLGQLVRSFGLVPWDEPQDTPAYAMLHVERYETPTNRETFGEYGTTSWKLKACTHSGCSPFTEVLTVN